MKKTKRKLIFIVCSLIVITAIVAGIMIWVLAAVRQSISSSINISYTADGVYGKITAYYQTKADEATGTKHNFETTSGGTELTFPASTGNNTLVANSGNDIVLTSSNNYLVICYEITNTGSPVILAKHSKSTSADATFQNVKILYSTDGVNYVESNQDLTIDSDGVAKYYVKIQLDNVALNAKVTGGFNWALSDLTDEPQN